MPLATTLNSIAGGNHTNNRVYSDRYWLNCIRGIRFEHTTGYSTVVLHGYEHAQVEIVIFQVLVSGRRKRNKKNGAFWSKGTDLRLHVIL